MLKEQLMIRASGKCECLKFHVLKSKLECSQDLWTVSLSNLARLHKTFLSGIQSFPQIICLTKRWIVYIKQERKAFNIGENLIPYRT